jgi:hypothetical protein
MLVDTDDLTLIGNVGLKFWRQLWRQAVLVLLFPTIKGTRVRNFAKETFAIHPYQKENPLCRLNVFAKKQNKSQESKSFFEFSRRRPVQ